LVDDLIVDPSVITTVPLWPSSEISITSPVCWRSTVLIHFCPIKNRVGMRPSLCRHIPITENIFKISLTCSARHAWPAAPTPGAASLRAPAFRGVAKFRLPALTIGARRRHLKFHSEPVVVLREIHQGACRGRQRRSIGQLSKFFGVPSVAGCFLFLKKLIRREASGAERLSALNIGANNVTAHSEPLNLLGHRPRFRGTI
jgi:hypothetical protein